MKLFGFNLDRDMVMGVMLMRTHGKFLMVVELAITI
jgi:hypothetical protein